MVSVSVVHERNKASLLSLSKQHIHVSTNEYRLNRQTYPRIQFAVRDLNKSIRKCWAMTDEVLLLARK